MAGPGDEDMAFNPEDGDGGCHQEAWARAVRWHAVPKML